MKKRDADFLTSLAAVATQVQAIKTEADRERWVHAQMIHNMNTVLASAAVLSL